MAGGADTDLGRRDAQPGAEQPAQVGMRRDETDAIALEAEAAGAGALVRIEQRQVASRAVAQVEPVAVDDRRRRRNLDAVGGGHVRRPGRAK
jgi:hypothetical protein